MKRVNEIESEIRDSEIIAFKINWNFWNTESFNQDEGILLKFIKNENLITLKLKGLDIVDFYEIEFIGQYITHLKCFIEENEMIWLVLDPYDERIKKIEERDNFKIRFKEYELEIIDIKTNKL